MSRSDGFGLAELLPGISQSSVAQYEVMGSDLQVLNLVLKPGATVRAEPGAMMAMDDSIAAGVDFSNGWNRCCSGEVCFFATFTNRGGANTVISLSPNKPHKVIPLDLSQSNSKFHTSRGAFLAGLGDTRVGYSFDCRPRTCCFGGQGCVRQSIEGNSLAFISGMGTVLVKELRADETIVLDTSVLLAWEKSVTLDVALSGSNCCTICCAGESLTNTTMTGPGKIFVTTYSMQKFTANLRAYAMLKSGATVLASGSF